MVFKTQFFTINYVRLFLNLFFVHTANNPVFFLFSMVFLAL